MSHEKLSELIRPAGYFNIKTKRLKAFVEFFVNHYSGNISQMKRRKSVTLREEILSIYGIGPETADSMFLYALDKPVFVIDAYTKRVLSRHGILDYVESYDRFQELFHNSLPQDVPLYNEYHALLVRVGKEFCRTRPRCERCVLHELKR